MNVNMNVDIFSTSSSTVPASSNPNPMLTAPPTVPPILQPPPAPPPPAPLLLPLKPWLPPPPPPTLLRNLRLIDPSHARLTPNAIIALKHGRVAYSGSMYTPQFASVLEAMRGEVDIVDLGGRFVCPGLVDCHVHVGAVPGVRGVGEGMRLPVDIVTLRSTYVLREMLSRGFTTVRDAGGATAALAEAIDEWLIPGPRLIQCGKALSQTGGHGDPRSATDDSPPCCGGRLAPGLSRVCDGVPEVLAATRDEIRKGAKFIKVMCGGGVASPTDPLLSLQFTPAELQAISTTCMQMFGPTSYRLSAHAYSPSAIRHAMDSGVNAIEHGAFLDRGTAREMAGRGVFFVPTVGCYGVMGRARIGAASGGGRGKGKGGNGDGDGGGGDGDGGGEWYLDEEGRRKNEEVMEAGIEAIRIAEEEGVVVCFGTDLLGSLHQMQTEEFVVRSKVLPSPTILRHATTNAARLLQLEGKIGTLDAGAHADLIVLAANPLEDITILDRPEENLLAVMKGGYVVRSKLEGLPVNVGVGI